MNHFWHFKLCKRSLLRSQCWMRLFLWFSNTVDGDVWSFRFRFLGSLWNEKLPLKCSSSEEVAYALYWRADFPVHLRPLHTRPWGPKRGFYRRLGTTYQYAGIKRCLDGGAGRSTSWRKWLRSASKYWTAIPCRLFACPKRNTCLQGLSRSWNRRKKICFQFDLKFVKSYAP